MLCTGEDCARKAQCARYCLNAPPDGEVHSLESLYYYGTSTLGSDGTIKENWWCSPLGNWGMFMPTTVADDTMVEIDGVCFYYLGNTILYSYDRATWDRYDPGRFNDIIKRR